MRVSEIVVAALRKIGVAGHGQTATAEQIQAGVQAFNMMIHGWRLEGMDISLFPNAPAAAILDDFEVGDEAPIPSAFLESVVFCLAARIAPEYQIAFAEPEAATRRLQAALVQVPEVRMPQAVVAGAVYPRRFLR